MRIGILSKVALFFLVALPANGESDELAPFWERRPELVQQVRNERRVLVSVRQGEGGDAARMLGVGVVHAPAPFVKRQVGDFEKLKEVSSYFKSVRHDKDKQELELDIEAMGFSTSLKMTYKWRRDGQSDQLGWQVVEGSFQGMQGHFQLKHLEAKKTEVVMWTRIAKPKVYLPDFLLNFTLEVIAEKVAQKMRTYIESAYNKPRSAKGKDSQ